MKSRIFQHILGVCRLHSLPKLHPRQLAYLYTTSHEHHIPCFHHDYHHHFYHHHHHHLHQANSLMQSKKLSHLSWCKTITYDAAISAQIKEWEQFIKANTEVSCDHLTPEITLRLITPKCHLWSVPYEECEETCVKDPYWAFYWPGGQALTRYLLDNPSLVRGKSVLDIGSGCGASAIACKLAGASRVLANDIDPVAVQAIKMNAALNHVTMETSTKNLIVSHITDDWDVLVLGDMFYDTDFTDMVSDWLKSLSPNKTVLIGDPGRFCLKTHPIRKQLVNIYEVELPEHSRLENSRLTQGFVWQLLNHAKDEHTECK